MQDPAPETISAAFGVGGQVVVVTGAAGTIGSAIAATLSRNGARVMLSDRAGAALEALRCTLEAAGADVRSEPADLVAPGDLDRLVAATLAAYGRIDALVNCGAITGSRPWDVEAVADFDRLYHTNVRSAWLLTQSVAKSMIATGGGSIVNIASINGHRATFPCALYAGTKAALMAMTRDLAIELAPHAIRLNSISPGYIAHIDREGHWVDRYLKTPWADEAYAMVREAMRASAANGQPLARVGTPADIAWACWSTAGNCRRCRIANRVAPRIARNRCGRRCAPGCAHCRTKPGSTCAAPPGSRLGDHRVRMDAPPKTWHTILSSPTEVCDVCCFSPYDGRWRLDFPHGHRHELDAGLEPHRRGG
jgi:NAD(P)-dependent dehydrogenase (short-subunit alcohol dehydrogenase family)